MKLDTSGLDSFSAEQLDLDADQLFTPAAFHLPAGCADFDKFQAEAKKTLKHAKGTTTLAFIFNEGVIVAADSRASMGGYICVGFDRRAVPAVGCWCRQYNIYNMNEVW